MNAFKLRIVFPFTIIAGATLSGCTSLQNVHVDDERVRDVAGSIVFRPESLQFENHRTQGGIELAYERHRGSGTQTITGSGQVNFGGLTIAPPQTLANDADSEHGHVAFNLLIPMGRYAELEPSLGVALDSTTVNVRSNSVTTPVATQKERNWGIHGQIVPRWNFNDYIAVEGRVRVSLSRDSGNSRTIIPALVVKPSKNIAINAGYMWYAQELETPNSTSNVQIRFEGPSLALRLSF